MSKLKLVIPEIELKKLPELSELKFSLNGKKKSKGKNQYKKALGRLRRSLRW